MAKDASGKPVFISTTKTVPCVTCPWRRSSTVGGDDIPGFSIEMMRNDLSKTVGEGDAFRAVMACHYHDAEPCIGYIAVEGWSNLRVRIMALDHMIDIGGIQRASDALDLWPGFWPMLEAYEAAQ